MVPSARTSPRSVQGVVTETLAKLIIGGEIPPGALLPNEAALMARYGMSRTVLRESIKTLSAKGMLASRARVGTRALPSTAWHILDPDILTWRMEMGIDESFLRDLSEVRKAIEPAAAAPAAVRHNPQHIADLHEAFAAMETSTTRSAFAAADLAFHMAVLNATGNTLMRGIGAVIETALAAAFTLSSPVADPARHRIVLAGHRRIMDMLIAGDGQAASKAMFAVII